MALLKCVVASSLTVDNVKRSDVSVVWVDMIEVENETLT